MEINRLVSKYVYRIEPKPDGGFIARASDPSVPSIEAASREELQQKIQAAVFAGLGADFPGFKLPANAGDMKFAFHVERTPGGTFDIHSSDPNSAPVQASTQGEVENHFAEKFISLLGKHMLPGLSDELRQQLASGNVKVFMKGGSEFTITTTETTTHTQLGSSSPPLSGPPTTSSGPIISTSPIYSNSPTPIDSSPITPVSEGGGKFFRILLALLVLAGVIYFLLQHMK
ncbi:MAG TPA: hypothetical protein VF447_08905 [Terriglobales bacterium]